ncbi:MAG TPA: 2-dehydropantoate 2-reductase [Candidatus Baltobacteraceae bacterium]|jgi:2-dehydropantoate 2-reductase|nr:2-dehydropantoate 2-reductase [Candidatus Baltobacteraceae bacterium]
MKHAILGTGAVGGLIAAILASSGEDVTAIVRTPVPDGSKAVFEVRRADGTRLFGPVRTVETLWPHERVDILWIATKAYDLENALERVGADSAQAVIPLLNGVEHVTLLRRKFDEDRVLPATIAVDAQRLAPGMVRQNSPFVRLVLAARAQPVVEPFAALLEKRDVTIVFEADETTLLWNKIVFLAPFALVTAASRLNAGAIREHAQWRSVFLELAQEVAAAARAEGAKTDPESAIAMLDRVAPGMTSSLFRDLESGKTPELDAIVGDPIRAAERHALGVPLLRKYQREIGAPR